MRHQLDSVDLMVQETIIGDLRKRGIELVSVAEPEAAVMDKRFPAAYEGRECRQEIHSRSLRRNRPG